MKPVIMALVGLCLFFPVLGSAQDNTQKKKEDPTPLHGSMDLRKMGDLIILDERLRRAESRYVDLVKQLSRSSDRRGTAMTEARDKLFQRLAEASREIAQIRQDIREAGELSFPTEKLTAKKGLFTLLLGELEGLDRLKWDSTSSMVRENEEMRRLYQESIRSTKERISFFRRELGIPEIPSMSGEVPGGTAESAADCEVVGPELIKQLRRLKSVLAESNEKIETEIAELLKCGKKVPEVNMSRVKGIVDNVQAAASEINTGKEGKKADR